MCDDELKRWMHSGQYAQVNGARLRPLKHPALPEMPLVVERGQAAALFARAADGSDWIIKKFYEGRCPDKQYLREVSHVLPRHPGFRSGTDRKVLTPADLRHECDSYFSSELEHWLAGTVLMRRVTGVDWASLADELRAGHLQLDRQQRATLCRRLAELVQAMEAGGCAHRDISSGNVFIDSSNWQVMLIDFDSVYHPTLRMPAATTCGTEGYTGAFVWRNGTPRPEATWCPHADRFALTIACVEFLVLDAGSPTGAESGMFDQDQLRARSGGTLCAARDRLCAEYQASVRLFDTAIQSKSCEDCPAPGDWLSYCQAILGPQATPPALTDLEIVLPDYFAHLLRRRVRPAPIWPAPRLSELPNKPIVSRVLPSRVVPLPRDPWAPPCAASLTKCGSFFPKPQPCKHGGNA